MCSQQDDHHLRGVVVDPPQQPAAPHLVLDEVDALPRGGGTGTVVHPQEQPGDHLDGEGEGERAAPDVAPARAAGHVLVQGGLEEAFVAGAVVEPGEETHA